MTDIEMKERREKEKMIKFGRKYGGQMKINDMIKRIEEYQLSIKYINIVEQIDVKEVDE